MSDKQADLAGPGVGNYEDVAEILPGDYSSLLTPRETQQAIFAVGTQEVLVGMVADTDDIFVVNLEEANKNRNLIRIIFFIENAQEASLFHTVRVLSSLPDAAEKQ